MAYVNGRRSRRQALSGVQETISKAKDVLTAANTILNDPALPEVTSIVMELHKMEPPSKTGKPSPGIGLRRVVPALKAYRYAAKHKWVLPTVVAGALIVPFFLGYAVGKR